MKALFVLHEVPVPATNGHRQKITSLIEYMSRRHDCALLALGTPEDVARGSEWADTIGARLLGVFPVDAVRGLRAQQAAALLLGRPEQASIRHRSAAMEKAFDAALRRERFDIVHADLISMAPFCSRARPVRSVLSLNDSLSLTMFGRMRNPFAPITFRVAATVQGVLQMRIDQRLFDLADAVHFVGNEDAQWSRRRFGARNATYIPLAVPDELLHLTPVVGAEREHTVLIVDKLWADQHRNAIERFLAVHWPLVRQRHPAARLVVIGGMGIPASFRALAAAIPGVELHEWVDDFAATVARAGVAVFPYSVEVGMKTRVIQCMAGAVAVVGSVNSFMGLGVQNGREAVVADTLDLMRTAVERLLENPEESRSIGLAARRFIESRLTQSIVGEAWEELYGDVIRGAPIRNRYGAAGVESN